MKEVTTKQPETKEFKKELKDMVRKYPQWAVKGKRKHPKHITQLAAKIKLYHQYEQQIPEFTKVMEKEEDLEKKTKMESRIRELNKCVDEIPQLVTTLNLYLVEHKQMLRNKKIAKKSKKKGLNKKRKPFPLGTKIKRKQEELPKNIKL